MSSTCVGKFWAVTSLVASVAGVVGLYFPYWLEGFYETSSGELIPFYFGIFRRCTYPIVDGHGHVHILNECGIYSTFYDIPSMYWQIGTVTVGIGSCLGLLLAMTGMVALCIRDIITVKVARIAGVIQMLAGMLISTGVSIYPLGWTTPQVVQACGHRSDLYQLGDCNLYWAFYLTAAAGGVTLLCSTLTCHSFKSKPFYGRKRRFHHSLPLRLSVCSQP